jgi:hypothetical protein
LLTALRQAHLIVTLRLFFQLFALLLLLLLLFSLLARRLAAAAAMSSACRQCDVTGAATRKEQGKFSAFLKLVQPTAEGARKSKKMKKEFRKPPANVGNSSSSLLPSPRFCYPPFIYFINDNVNIFSSRRRRRR